MAAIAQRFQRANGGQRVGAAAAIFHGNRQSLNAKVGALLPQVFGKFLVVVAGDDIVFQLLAGKTENLFAKSCLLVIPSEVQGLSFLLSFRPNGLNRLLMQKL